MGVDHKLECEGRIHGRKDTQVAQALNYTLCIVLYKYKFI